MQAMYYIGDYIVLLSILPYYDIAQINQSWESEQVSNIRPEAWWSYHSQGYKGPNGLSL